MSVTLSRSRINLVVRRHQRQQERAETRGVASRVHLRALLMSAGLAGSVLPIPTPAGTLYLLEAVVIVRALHILVREPRRVRIGLATAAMIALVAMLVAQVVVGLHGPAMGTIHNVRVLVEFACALLLADADPSFRRVVVKNLPWIGLSTVAAMGVEWWIGHPLVVGESASAYDETSNRIMGPLGPGATATLLLCAIVVAAHRMPKVAPLLVLGVLMTASRAHLFAMAIVLVVYVLRTRRARLPAVVAIAGSWWLLSRFEPGTINRFTGYTKDADDRYALWHEAWLDITQHWVWGVGPANLWGNLTGNTGLPGFPHNQYLVLPVFAGIIGWIVTWVVLVTFVARARSAELFLFSIGMLVAAVFGETIIPVIAGTGVAATVQWMLISTPGWSRTGND